MLRALFCIVISACLWSSPVLAKSWFDTFLPSDKQETPTLAIISASDFIPDTTGAEQLTRNGLPDVLVDRLVENLSNSKRFIITERQALRRIVMEQRFEENGKETTLDRALNTAISNMDQLENSKVLGVTLAASRYNDSLKDFQYLGKSVKARYLLMGNLEKMKRSTEVKSVPFSKSNRKSVTSKIDSRLRLRVIDTNTGTVLGATSTRVQLSENLYAGRKSDNDDYTAYDQIARIAAVKILDIVYPAAVAGIDPLVISRGSNDGIKVGDTFDIRRPGQIIKDPSGIELGKVLSDVGSAEVTKVQDRFSVVKVASGQPPQIGDIATFTTNEIQQPNDAASGKTAPLPRSITGTPRIAVGLTKVRQGFNPDESAAINRFTDFAVTRLNKTQRFQVVDRQDVDQLLDEQTFEALGKNADMPSAVGSLTGVDYLILARVSDFKITSTTKKIPYVDKLSTTREGFASGTVRIIDVHSGIVKASNVLTIEKNFEAEETANLSKAYTSLIKAFTDQAVTSVINTLFPIKIISAPGGEQIFINRGQDGQVKVGQKYNVYRQGEKLIDPDTNIALGYAETKIGVINIIEVQTSRSIGLMINDDIPQKGDILRLHSSSQPKLSNQKTKKRPAKINKPNW